MTGGLSRYGLGAECARGFAVAFVGVSISYDVFLAPISILRGPKLGGGPRANP
jgi:hypothetical protein